MKPSQQFYNYVLNRLGAKPEERILIDDEPLADVLGPGLVRILAVLIARTPTDPTIGAP